MQNFADIASSAAAKKLIRTMKFQYSTLHALVSTILLMVGMECGAKFRTTKKSLVKAWMVTP